MSQNAVIFLVLCGIVVLFATGAMKRSAEQERETRKTELELAGGEVALELLTRADALLFDSRTQTSRVLSAADLTPLPFATGGAFSRALDLDDLHANAPRTVGHTSSGLTFEVTARVEYVDDNDRVSAVPTLAKRVVAVVRHADLPRPLEVSRTYELELGT